MYNTDAVNKLPNTFAADERAEFYIAIVYDGLAAGTTALKLSEHLQEQFGGELDMRRTLRPFALVGNSADHVPEDRKRPDMIIIASHRSSSLPVHLVTWLTEALTPEADCPQALVALVNMGSANEITAIYRQLEEAATRASATFFHHQPGSEKEEPWKDLTGPHLEKGWGLNE
jgi:hypothetical protein